MGRHLSIRGLGRRDPNWDMDGRSLRKRRRFRRLIDITVVAVSIAILIADFVMTKFTMMLHWGG